MGCIDVCRAIDFDYAFAGRCDCYLCLLDPSYTLKNRSSCNTPLFLPGVLPGGGLPFGGCSEKRNIQASCSAGSTLDSVLSFYVVDGLTLKDAIKRMEEYGDELLLGGGYEVTMRVSTPTFYALCENKAMSEARCGCCCCCFDFLSSLRIVQFTAWAF